jgi:hypothetical protein
MKSKHFFMIAFISMNIASSIAQSPVSGFMSGKGKGSISVTRTEEKYNEVLLNPVDIGNVPVFNNVKVTSYSIYGVYGLSDKLDIIFNLPQIKAEGNATATVLSELGYENERSGIQDGGLFVKYLPTSFGSEDNKVDVILTGGIRTPFGSYKVDEGLQSILAIGNRATSINGIGALHYKNKSGIFVTTQGGYSLRTGVVPDAVIGEIKLGAASKFGYYDVWFAGQKSLGGVDILGDGFTGIFPETEVTYSRVGANAYFGVGGGFGLGVGYSQYLKGRNVGKASGLSISLGYSF